MLTKQERYVLRLVTESIIAAVNDDFDDQGIFNCSDACDHPGFCPGHEEALELAVAVSEWIEHHPSMAKIMFRRALLEHRGRLAQMQKGAAPFSSNQETGIND
jgi:hypothetical protein